MYVCGCVAVVKAATPTVTPAASVADMDTAIKLEEGKDDTNVSVWHSHLLSWVVGGRMESWEW